MANNFGERLDKLQFDEAELTAHILTRGSTK